MDYAYAILPAGCWGDIDTYNEWIDEGGMPDFKYRTEEERADGFGDDS